MAKNYKAGMIKTTVIYFIGQMSSRFLTVLLLPLYTNHIRTEAYGYFDIVQIYLNVAVPFFFFEIWSALLRFALEEKRKEEKAKIITNCIAICSGSALLFCGLYYIFQYFVNIEYSGYVIIYAITWMIQLMSMSICRGFQDNIGYAISGIIGVLAVSVFSLLGVFVFKWEIETLFISNIISFVLQSIFVLIRTRYYRYIKVSLLRKKVLYQLLRFSIPLSINTIFYWLLNSVNRVIIVENLGYGANGVYSVANKLGNIVSALVAIFMLSWQEMIYKLEYKDKNEIQEMYDSEFGIVKRMLMLGVIALIPITNIFFDILIGNDYKEVFSLILPMYFMVFVTSLNAFIDVVYSAVHDTKSLLYVKVISGITNLLFMLLLVKKLGLFASPIAIIFAQIVALISNIVFLKPYLKIRIGYKYIAASCGLFIISSWIYLNFNKLINFIWLIILGIGILAVMKSTLAEYAEMIKQKFVKKYK